MITIQRVTHDSELRAIQALQCANLRKNVSETEAAENGFLMAEYSLEFLRQMHECHPAILALDGTQLAGYALVASRQVRDGHPLLDDLCTQIDGVIYQGRKLADAKYVVVGQLCVAKAHRGKGLVQRMYQHFRESLQPEYAYCITDIAQDNPRSLRAHLKTGFQVIHSIEFDGLVWNVVLWDWTDSQR